MKDTYCDKEVYVDGYCRDNNTVYQFHGCFYHGCLYRYESCAPTPHREKRYVKKQDKEVAIPINFGKAFQHLGHDQES